MTDNAQPTGLMTEQEAARYLCMGLPTLRRTRRERLGPTYIQLGKSVRYRIADLDAWVNAHTVQGL